MLNFINYITILICKKLSFQIKVELFMASNLGEFKHEVRQFQKPYDNQQAEQISLMV